MTPALPFRRDAPPGPGQRVAGPYRTRHPLGIVSPTEATARIAGLVDQSLTRVELSLDRLVLTIPTDPGHQIVLAGTLVVTTADGRISVLADPGNWQAEEVARGWVGTPITAAEVSADGTLRLAFGGVLMQVDPDPDHESWEIRRADGWLLACLPGGSVSLWTPTLGDIPSAN